MGVIDDALDELEAKVSGLRDANASLLALVREVAETDPIGYWASQETDCLFCHAYQEPHRADCLWKRCKALVDTMNGASE